MKNAEIWPPTCLAQKFGFNREQGWHEKGVNEGKG